VVVTMPVLVLPRGVPGVNDFEMAGARRTLEPGAADAADAADAVVALVVPSVTRLVQAAWLRSLRRLPRLPFADWLEQELTTGSGAPEWSYGRAAARWADAIGSGRLHVVAGEDPAATEETLFRIAGAPVRLRGRRRRLEWAEVATVERLAGELTDLGLTGRNAVQLLDGAVHALETSQPPAEGPITGSRLSAQQEHRLLELSEAMLAATDASGATVHGDRSALLWRAITGSTDDTVALDSAVVLSVGVLDRVVAWGTEEAR
jgi:hypothetical protein